MTSLGIMASGMSAGYLKVANLGTQVAAAAAATLVITTLAPIDVGDLIVVRAAADNASATTPTMTCADSGGNSYTTHRQGGQNATAAAGVVGGIMVSKATTAIATGGTITVTFSLSTSVARAAYAQSFIGFNNTTRSTPVGSSGASTALSAGASGTVNAGDLVLGFGAIESNAAISAIDTDVLNGAWSPNTALVSAAGGTATARVQVSGQYKIPNASGAQTFNQTVPNTDWVSGCVVLQAA